MLWGGTSSSSCGSAFSWDTVDAHVGSQDLRHDARAIDMLVVFDHGDQGAANGETRTVQGMDKLALAGDLRLEADSGAAGLKRFAVRAGRDFAEFLARWQPDFNVVGFCGSKTHIARTEQHGAVMQAEFLQDSFGVANQRFMFFVTFFRMREFEEFHFLKLMLTQNSASIFPGGASFGTQTCRPGSDADRKPIF